jgi:hypothetical protein
MACQLNYILSGITGDCSNTGVGGFSIIITGSAPDYTIQWTSPTTNVIPLGPGVTSYTETNLTAGVYTFNLIDSCIPTNTSIPISIYISSGTCVSIDGVSDTLCNQNNGSITASTFYDYGNTVFSLYHTTLGLITQLDETNVVTFNDLAAGTYYVVADDGGGCTGQSSTIIVKTSTNLDYGFYIVNDAGCTTSSGKAIITGLTGNPPYTYLWENGETTDSITGLTSGSYGVSVTDRNGCIVNKVAEVNSVDLIGQSGVLVTQPACFGNNGTIAVFVSGGTAPFYFSGSNGTVDVTFANYYLFENLAAGTFSYFVQDSALCSFTGSQTLTTPKSFDIININVVNSRCGNNQGSINPVVSSGTPPYVFNLTDPNGNNNSVSTTLPSYTFNGLSTGTYTLSILDGGGCEYINTYTISNDPVFTYTLTSTGTTCALSNGYVLVEVTGGLGPFVYEIDGQSTQTIDRSFLFNNVPSGSHTIIINDLGSVCKQSDLVFVGTSVSTNIITSSVNPTGSNNGVINVMITSGKPPFVLDWSDNVNGQTGMTVTNLSAGTYTIKVTDDNGCVSEKTIILEGVNCSVSYEIYNFAEDLFENNGDLIKKGTLQMLNEGYFDLTKTDNDCILNNAVFEAVVSVSGVSANTEFYTGYTLNDVPSNTLYSNTIRNLLLSFEGIGNVVINNTTNKIVITTDCNSSVSLLNAQVIINLIIHYDISCVSCAFLPCTYDQDGVCDGYKLYETLDLNMWLPPTTQDLELWDGGNGGSSNGSITVFKYEQLQRQSTAGCLNSYYPPGTPQEDIDDANRELRNAARKAKTELNLATGPFMWAALYVPSFQINKYY